MSGELTLERSGWPRLAATVAAVCLLDGALMVFLLPHLHLPGMAQAVVCALTAYLLFRLLYPAISALLPGGTQAVSWSVTATELRLGGDTVARDTIKMVPCWPGRDALGNRRSGYTVNIETAGKNFLLHSLAEGQDAEKSASELRALVSALGYSRQWPEE